MSLHYYNEFNPESAAMLRQMIADGLIPKGDVDERSITDISPDDVRGYTQCHWFAGIGGWAFALQYAGWPEDRPVWTGSCPCQPFSSAGRQKGKDDDRHLWPVWQRLISECRPATVYGEQVASAIAHGWLDDVYQGLEAQGYAVGSAVLPACSVGAPHKRDRLWFVAHAEGQRYTRGELDNQAEKKSAFKGARENEGLRLAKLGIISDDVVNTFGNGCNQERECQPSIGGYGIIRNCGVMDNSQQSGLEGQSWHDGAEKRRKEQERPATAPSHWDSGQWIDCPDGKQRLIEPSIPLLADGVQHRRPILHGFGNAIVPQLAGEFIKASM